MTPRTFATAPRPFTARPGPGAGARTARHHQCQVLFHPLSRAVSATPRGPAYAAGTGFSAMLLPAGSHDRSAGTPLSPLATWQQAKGVCDEHA